MRTIKGIIVDPVKGTRQKGQINIENGLIAKVSYENESDVQTDEIVDYGELCIAPGLIDVHSHFRDPGFTAKEDIYTGAKAAAAGGYTTVVLMCNTKPTVDNADTLQYVLGKGRETDIHVESCCCVTKGLKGEELVDYEEMLRIGAVGMTDDGIPLMDVEVLREAMKESARLGIPISLHEEDKNLISQNGINHGKASEFYGIEGSPKEAEISLIRRDLKIALDTDAILNVQHISTREGVELVRNAKKESKTGRIHAEATPGHIALTEDAVIAKGSMAKLNPPFRCEEDRLAIIEGLKDGTIDIIATDHAPHTEEEKSGEITTAPSGIIGLETALAVALTNLYKTGEMTIPEIIAKFTSGPAKLYNFKDRGTLEVGARADLVVFDPDEEWTVTTFKSKAKNSPFVGEQLYGRVKHTICDGKLI